MKPFITLILSIFFFSAQLCQAQSTAFSTFKIDASSNENFGKSLETLQKTLPPAEMAQFMEAYEVIYGKNGLSNHNSPLLAEYMEKNKEKYMKGDPSWEQILRLSFSFLDGKTPAEVVALARETQARISGKQKEDQALINEALKKIEIKNVRYNPGSKPGDYSIVADIKNGFAEPIKTISFSGELSSPDRKVPWVTDDYIVYSFSPPLEPGKEGQIVLKPSNSVGRQELKQMGDAADKKAAYRLSIIGWDDTKGNMYHTRPARIYSRQNPKG